MGSSTALLGTLGLETGLLDAFRASATAAAMEGWSWETTEEVTAETEGWLEEVDLVTPVGAEMMRRVGAGREMEEVEVTLPTMGVEAKLEEEEGEEVEDRELEPIEARACWMAGCKEASTSPTTSLSLI